MSEIESTNKLIKFKTKTSKSDRIEKEKEDIFFYELLYRFLD